MGKRKIVDLTVTVTQARGLTSSKGAETPLSSCVTFKLPGAEEPVESEVKEETSEPEYAFESAAPFTASDDAVTALLATPLVITLLEAPEKTPLGSVSIDLTPLLQAPAIEAAWMHLTPPEGSEVPAGEVFVGVSVGTPLLTEDDFEESSLLELSLLSLQALPPKWTEGAADEESHPYTYSATVELPLVEGFEPVTFEGGKLVVPPPPAEEAAPAEGEEAAEPAAEPPEPEPYKIAWDGAACSRFLGPKALDALRTALEGGGAICAFKLGRVVKNPEALVDSNAAKYAAVAECIPSGLLEIDALEAEAKAALLPDPNPPEVEPPADAGGKGKGKGGPEVTAVEDEEETHPYVAASTALQLGFHLSRPMVPRPPTPPPPLPKVADLIPKRVLPQFAAKTAAAEYQAQIAALVETLVSEWAQVFPELDLSQPSTNAQREERRKALLYKLNSEGKYWMYKERLKRCIVRIVKETMNRPGAEPLDSHAMQIFYNELYVTLTKQLHAALNQIFFPAVKPPTAPSAPDSLEGKGVKETLKVLATEMEIMFRFDKAAVYQQERVASCKYDATCWYDYALFLMRTGDMGKAEECTKEAIALQQGEFDYLFAHGCILATRGKYDDAEAYLKEALDLMPHDIEMWLLMSLLYAAMGRGRDARLAVKQAKQMQGHEDLAEGYYQVAFRCLKVNARPLIEWALKASSDAEGEEPDNHHLPLCQGKMLLTCGEAQAAAEEFLKALAVSKKSVSGWTLLGQARVLMGQADGAKKAFTKALDLSQQPMPLLALLHLGTLCLHSGEPARAKELFLLACRQMPSCTSWLGVGTACLKLHQLDEAEEALAEANVLNNRDEHVWAQLALLCTQQSRFEEGGQALKQALKLGLADAPLLSQIGTLFASYGKWADAEACLRRALGGAEDAKTCALLADCLFEQKALDEALATYERALSLPDISAQETDVAGHCTARVRELKRVVMGGY